MFLIDFHNYLPPEELRVNYEEIKRLRFEAVENSEEFRRNHFHTDDVEVAKDVMVFQDKIWGKAGLGHNHTYLPKNIHPKYSCTSFDTSIPAALEEARMCLCGAMEGLLHRTGLRPSDIDILVTTCSIFCPTPSMASMVVNAFSMRQDVQAYHLGGMGCSNGVVAVNLVKDLLKARPGARAVLLTTETTGYAVYGGVDKHRQVTNMIFRMGGAAVLFATAPVNGRAKYRLLHNYRVHAGSRDDAYRCIWYGPDDDGHVGVYLGLDVVSEASRALTVAMTKVAPHLLSVKQVAAYLKNAAQRALLGKDSVPPYRPDFSLCADKFLIHAGGAKVLDGIGKELHLSVANLAPSRAVLHDYGNVSSSTTWYSLGFCESVEGVHRGARILQIGVGSGVKCGVNVWRALTDIRDVQEAWAHRLSADEADSVRRKWASKQARRARRPALHALLFLLLAVLVLAVAMALEPGAVRVSSGWGKA